MAGVRGLTRLADLEVCRGWGGAPPGLLEAMRQVAVYADDRATGWLYGDQDWPAPLAEHGPLMLAALFDQFRTEFEYVAYQGYRDGSGCGWHDDATWAAQAILSLGVTRTFGIRPKGGEPEWIQVGHRDLVYMPAGFGDGHEHCVPTEDVPGERISLVFRTRS